jgi:hypothetical protein
MDQPRRANGTTANALCRILPLTRIAEFSPDTFTYNGLTGEVAHSVEDLQFAN